MKRRSFLLVLALLLQIEGCRSPRQSPSEHSEAQGTPSRQRVEANGSGFDYYLLNLSWSPEFCHGHPDAPECAARATFVLHGLWPQNNGGGYPENCSTAPGPSDPSNFKDIYPEQGLLEHEWRTHGTCSGLNPDDFFENARSAFKSVKIPPSLNTLNSQISLPPDHIVSLFTTSNPGIPASSLVVSCGHNYLTAIEVCLNKGLHPIPCVAVRSCSANTVRIPPP